MRGEARRRTVIAWLLTLTLMPFFMVKAFHYHEDDHSVVCDSHQDGHSHDSADQCPICLFTLSPFTQGEIHSFHVWLPVFRYEPESHTYEVRKAVSFPYHLRAPPCFC